MKRFFYSCLLILMSINLAAAPPKGKNDKSKENKLDASLFSGLKFRGVGPALTSGRIIDFAVHPENRKVYYAAIASGGVWKTTNSGTTWQPVFDGQNSYSIGCITLDPNNPHIVWVGSGENNSQRSVGYGDGVYKSLDGGASWSHMGLKTSEHIGMIAVDPRNSNVVYVASQGPLWSAGGERGLYKSINGGEKWDNILSVDEHTGISEVHFDPRNPDVLYAVAYQRRRHVWTLINGGPGSTIYKSEDAGKNWRKIESGLPSGKMGRIGMDISPANPDVLYAVVEGERGKSGFFRSTNRGASWHKQSGYVSRSPQYYQELICDPLNVDRIYSMDVYMKVSHDAGKSFQNAGESKKHVDNHCLWIDPADTDYLLAGCDGGIYESFDRGQNWHYKANLPVTQFYKVEVDNDFPFYNIFGGTQDNFTLGGPARTNSASGIVNSDWFVTLGGDGFEPQIDPEDPNIIYSQYQHGNLYRFDKRSGEAVEIKPRTRKGEAPLKWNWDSPLKISPHQNTRLYFGANILYRSDDRGDSWRAVSGDLTRQIDRNKLKVMGKVWSVDAISKNRSTSIYGNLVALDESPLQEGLIYAGSDDGVVSITEDGGANWQKIMRIQGVPEMTYVNCLTASLHDANTVFAAFNNHKRGDFKPYVYKSNDRGKTWQSISGNLPERGSVYAIMQDHVKPDLLFAGTEFGVFFSIDGGKEWVQMKSGVPTIAVRDIAIQRRENDLVLGTFGRGFYVLDDYTPLRHITPEALNAEATLFPVKKTWMFIEATPMGGEGSSFQGASFYSAPNPPVGAVFTYMMKDSYKTRKQLRQKKEKQTEKDGGTVYYPPWEDLRAEMREEKAAVVFTVRDDAGNVVQRFTGPASKGMHRVVWNLRHAAMEPSGTKARNSEDWPQGYLALPGTYTVSMEKMIDGQLTALGTPQSFVCEPLDWHTLPVGDRAAALAFREKAAKLQRAASAADGVFGETEKRIRHIKQGLMDTPDINPALMSEIRTIENRLKDLRITFYGDPIPRRYYEPVPPSIRSRLYNMVYSLWYISTGPTATNQQAYDIAAEEFATLLPELRKIVQDDLVRIETEMEKAGAPWTPGRFPEWQKD